MRDGPRLWNLLLEAGKAYDLIPCGLGARDTLRLEAAMPLYGHEMDDTVDVYKRQTYGSLSQGEKQKVIIGRALISDPDIIIFDEACNGLDIFAKKDLYQLIETLAQDKKSIFFVTHNTDEILPIFNKALLIKDGKIHSKGNLKDVIQQENLQDFYGSDVDVFERNDRFFIFAK